jgi:2-dehydro-3-deoxyphosphogluconate aldolase/(4S)-4-hydroxy-2-oxoglutarate aldolase
MTDFLHDAFQKLPLIGIMRGYGKEDTFPIAEAYLASGLTTLEITLNTTGALGIISDMAKRYKGILNVGAGTVCTVDDLQEALNAGAGFIVTPVLNTEIISRCIDLNVPVFPGAYTPTEIYRAWDAGATMVKVFPAGQLGHDYIKQVKAPLNALKLLPTGGISLKNMGDYINAGANGFGLGSSLFHEEFIRSGNWVALQQHFKSYAALWTSSLNKI